MKLRTLKLFFALVFIASGAANASAQLLYGPEWGENATQEERYQNLLRFNYYKDAYEGQRYDDALGYLQEIITNSPRGANNIYVYAINIYKNKVARATDRPTRNAMVDSLFHYYDLRKVYFGDHDRYGRPYILKQEARDFLIFKPTDREGIRNIFEEAIAANEGNEDLDFINIYFNELTEDYKNGDLSAENYLEKYDALSSLMEAGDPSATDAKNTFDALFISSKAASCENLETIYSNRLAGDPDNLDVIRKAFRQLSASGCTSEFFVQVGEKYMVLEPSSSTAISLAKAFDQQGNSRKAIEYLRSALDTETDPIAKASLAVEIAGMELHARNAQSAANFARTATQLNPENGIAYIFLAQAYAEGAINANCDNFDKQSVYWLASDIAATGRNLVSGDAEQVRLADSLLAGFRSNFPVADDLFFRGLEEGQAYDVRCGWISGRTTVRSGGK